MATQPNLPNYQLSKLPDLLLAQQAQFNEGMMKNMDKLAANLAARKKQRLITQKEADAVENNFMNIYNQQAKTGIVAMDDANRLWATETSQELNRLYTKAYGSNGTAADRNLYKVANSQAMQNINIIGSFATIETANSKALSTDKNALSVNSKGEGLFTDESYYGKYEGMYNRATEFNSGLIQNVRVQTDPTTNRPVLYYDAVDAGGNVVANRNVQMGGVVAQFEKDGRDLNYLLVGKDDNVYDYTKKRYDDLLKDIIGKSKERITKKYDKTTNSWTQVKTVEFTNMAELYTTNRSLAEQINIDMNQSRFFAKWKQMQGDGSIEGLPGANIAWNTPDSELEQIAVTDATKSFDTNDDGAFQADEVRKMLRETAAQGLLNEYQKLRPPEEIEVAVTMSDGKPTTASGGYKDSQLAEWHNTNNRARYEQVTTDINGVISGKKVSGVIDMLDAQLKATHKTGADLTAAYNIPGLDPNKVYRYKLNSKGALTTQPVYTGFETSAFDNEDALRQQLYSLYNYDAEDQYFYGTDEGEAYLEQKIRS